MGNAEGLVEISLSPHLVIGFVEGIEEVSENHSDMDSSSMLLVSRGSRLRFGIAGPNCDTIVEGLQPSRRKLEHRSTFVLRVQNDRDNSRWAGMSSL